MYHVEGLFKDSPEVPFDSGVKLLPTNPEGE